MYVSMLCHEEGEKQQIADWMWANEYQDHIPVDQLSTQFVSVYSDLCDLLGAKVTPSVVLNDPLLDGEIMDVFERVGSQMMAAVGEVQTTQMKAQMADVDDESMEMKEDCDGTIRVPAKLYWPPLPSLYWEPELGSDLNDGMDWMFEEYGCVAKQSVEELPPRDDVVEFEFHTDSAELEGNLRLSGCPPELQPKIKEVIMEYWDMFCE